MRATLETVAGSPENQDRAAVIESSVGLVLVVADGAGGRSGGTEAAAMAIESVRQSASRLADASACAELLHKMDQAIRDDKVAGETTCAMAIVTEHAIYGASVGDSGVWVLNNGRFMNLTEQQSRKPFIGSGSAWAVPFDYKITGMESLLLGTDGLLKYAAPERIISICTAPEPSDVPRKLIELVRYPSGALPDDVTVIFAKATQ